MSRFKICAAIVAAGVLGTAAAQIATAQGAHTAVNANEMKWGAAPPALPPGAQAVILDGDPAKAGDAFTLRLKFPDGYKVPPHWHPTDERIVVLSGTLMMGVGEKGDAAKMHALTAGAFGKMPKEVRHYAAAKGLTVIQVSGIGPFEVNYVNPNDDPRRKKTQ
jgi:hypothetical protein